MLKHTLFFVLIVCFAWTGYVFGYQNGPDPGMNGVFGASINCTTGCHNSFPLNSGTGGVALTGQPANWTPGQTYSLTVTVQPSTGPTSKIYGFQLSAVVDSTNQQAGTLANVNGAVKIICGSSPSSGQINCSSSGAIQFAEHTNAGPPNTFSVNWTAPASASVGTVRFNVAGNAANGDFTNQGDHIYTQVYKVDPAAAVDLSTKAFTLVDRGGVSVITDGSGSSASVGYSRVLATSGSTPSGVAIFGYRLGGILVTEAGVPASPLIKNGRIYAEISPGGFSGRGTDIGLAIANPNSQDASITFTFTKSDGTDILSNTYVLPAGTQKAAYLDQDPWNGPLGFQGAFSFSSNVPISVVALQLYNNPRNEPLITTLPVINTDIAPGTAAAVLPYYTDGSGWSTSILLVNPTDTTMSGTIAFRDLNGVTVSLTANSTKQTSFSYTIQRRSSFKLQTAGTSPPPPAGGPQTGPVTVTPASGSNAPVPLVVFSFASGGTTITQAGVPANLATTFRMYVEATTGYGSIGSFSSGVAIANAAASAATVTAELFSPAGTSVASTTVTVPGNGVYAHFIQDIFQNLALPFQGVLRLTTNTSGISVVGLRIRFNERPGEFLMTTTPPTNEASTTTNAEFDFPQIVNGGGFTTEFILFSGSAGQTSGGNLKFVNRDGTSLNLTVN